jgi:glycosyltransferase involved in cell wall biosynthesis
MYEPRRSIVSIHDPMEVFPQEPNWKAMKPNSEQIELLKSLIFVNVISKEMQDMLSGLGVQTELISTATMLEGVSESKINSINNLGITSVCNIYPRKDIELLTGISEKLIKQGHDVNLKIGGEVLEEKEYIEFLRKNSIYICTSYQEGGPIPAMDAMSQGCVVLTTPVGQMLELIQDGYNGYFCITKQDFLDRCNYLAVHKDEFFQMRKNALSTIKNQRSFVDIDSQVESFLQKLI